MILTPWVKFLWESYRQCLELLRTNSRVEKLYHDTAQHAFKFCLKYARKTEFRKLCENLRSHLALMVGCHLFCIFVFAHLILLIINIPY